MQKQNWFLKRFYFYFPSVPQRLAKEEADEIQAAIEAEAAAAEFKDPAGPHGRREDALRHVVEKALALFPLLGQISEPYRQPHAPGQVESSDSEPEPEPEPEPRRQQPARTVAQRPLSPPARPALRTSPPTRKAQTPALTNEELEGPALPPLQQTAPAAFHNPWANLYPGAAKPVAAASKPTAAPKPAPPAVVQPQKAEEGEGTEEQTWKEVELKPAAFSNPWASVFGGASSVAAPKPAAVKKAAPKPVPVPAPATARAPAARPAHLPEDYVGVTAEDTDQMDADRPARSESYDYERAGRGGASAAAALGGSDEDDEAEQALMRGPGPEEDAADVDALLAQLARATSGDRAGKSAAPVATPKKEPKAARAPKPAAAAPDAAAGGAGQRKTKKQLKEEERRLKKKLAKEGKGAEAVREAIALFRATNKPGADPTATLVKAPAPAKDPNALPKSRPKAEAREALPIVTFMDGGDAAMAASRAKRKAEGVDLDKFASDDEEEAAGAEGPGVAAEQDAKGAAARKKQRRGAAEAPKGAELKSSLSIFLRHLGKSTREEDDAMKWDFKKRPRPSSGDRGHREEGGEGGSAPGAEEGDAGGSGGFESGGGGRDRDRGGSGGRGTGGGRSRFGGRGGFPIGGRGFGGGRGRGGASAGGRGGRGRH